jgi:hypothetical protein
MIQCPSQKHEPTTMQEVVQNGVNVDVCPFGCMFFDPGEINTYVNTLLSNGFNIQQPGYQVVPTIPQGQRIHNPAAYATHGFRGHHGGGHRRRGSSDGFFGSDGIFGSS